jgi:hypothetical protein
MFAAPLQCILVVWYSVCTTVTNGGTGTVPPLVMEIQTGSTNNHISQIFFVHLVAPILINRLMTKYCAGVSGNGNIINPRWRPNKKRNGHLSPRSKTNIYHLPTSRPPLFLIGHYLLVAGQYPGRPLIQFEHYLQTLFQLGTFLDRVPCLTPHTAGRPLVCKVFIMINRKL